MSQCPTIRGCIAVVTMSKHVRLQGIFDFVMVYQSLRTTNKGESEPIYWRSEHGSKVLLSLGLYGFIQPHGLESVNQHLRFEWPFWWNRERNNLPFATLGPLAVAVHLLGPGHSKSIRLVCQICISLKLFQNIHQQNWQTAETSPMSLLHRC